MGNSKSKGEHNNSSTNSRPTEFPKSKAKENSFQSPLYHEPQANTSKINNPYNYGIHKNVNEKRTQDLFHEFDQSHNSIYNDTVNIQPKFMTKTYIIKEEHDNKNQIIYSKNKSTIATAPSTIFAIATAPPRKSAIATAPPTMSKNDFMTEWFSWKNEFLTYMKSIDQTETNKQTWGMMLLNRMGPAGQEISRSFTFDKDYTEQDIDTLLKKFDFYCIFGDRKRGDDEDIDKYVNDLMVMASKHMTNTDKVVKEKILMEIDKSRFIRKAESLILGFSFPSSIQSLTVKEMTYIWMSYENANFKRAEEIHEFLIKNCHNCGRTHEINNCRARGKRCNKCGNENHYWTRCPSQFIANCLYCGEGHFVRECPAYMNECNRCNRTNHFSWKCSIPKVLNCNYCGLTHIAFKSACPAVNTICTRCMKRGHVSFKCYKKN